MFLQPFEINRESLVADIVGQDYRTAEVFRRYGIGYCCGGKWPMQLACEMQGVDTGKLQAELEKAIRTIPVCNQLDFTEWDIDFLINYIINIHHQYLRKNLPLVQTLVSDFSKEHIKKFTWLGELERKMDLLSAQLLTSMKKEEEVLFPYIRQVAHAHKDKEAYAGLLVRTLRKPVEEAMFSDYDKTTEIVSSIREITDRYAIPSNVCTSHKVVMAKLREQDNDIIHHLYLEQSILFPRAIAIEKEVLGVRDPL